MVTVGPNLAGTGADEAGVGTFVWSNPTHVTAEDASYADAVAGASPDNSHWLLGSNYGFSLGAAYIIRGVKAEVKRYGLAASTVGDHLVQLKIGGSYGGSDLGNHTSYWPTSLTWASYGDATNLWGYSSITAAQVNASGFGVGLSAGFNANGHGYVDAIRVTIYYDPGLQLSESDVPPVVPWFSIYSYPEVSIYTPTATYDSYAGLDLRLGSNGSMGSYVLDLPEEAGLEYAKVVKNDPIWFQLRQGPFERLLLGRIETVSDITAPSVDGTVLRLSGRGRGSFLLERNKAADYTAWTIYDILMDPTNGLASACSEIKFGDYVVSPGTATITTSARGRSIGEAIDELMVRAGTATGPYTYWTSSGEYPGEVGFPGFHFRPKVSFPAPVCISEDDVGPLERLSTLDFLRNAVEVEYGSSGATVTRNDTTSQAAWHIFYKYVYAPFLPASADANSWGDAVLNQTVNPLEAVTFTMPFSLGVMPNYTLDFYARTWSRKYEVSTVHHRLRPPRLCHTKITAATTTL
jgi:hypothetical protein